jgi:hypothetical protein
MADFGLRVHHKRAVLGHGLVDGAALQHQKFAFCVTVFCRLTAVALVDGGVLVMV